MDEETKYLLRKTLSYLLQGLLLLAPLIITLYVVVALFNFLDNVSNNMLEAIFNVRLRGLGILILLAFITLIGYISSNFLFNTLFNQLEVILGRTPLVKLIYTSIKDLLAAFVSDKKKFDKPVMVKLNEENKIWRMGFLTQENMAKVGYPEMVGVYLPHSYNFSGNFYVVHKDNVKPLNMSPTDTMKFIVSGGVTETENIENTEKNDSTKENKGTDIHY
ncbi:MAG: DUF502 domain-containing protein [Chitinophagaceae bacterium]|nr:MAG: DUF502 domain-containing protein [Chitinophagaceae bacterium]